MSVRKATKEEHFSLPQFSNRHLAQAEGYRQYRLDGVTRVPHRCKRDRHGNHDCNNLVHFHLIVRPAKTVKDDK